MAIYSMKGAKLAIGAAVAMKAGAWAAADFTTPLTAKTEVKEPETFAVPGEEFNAIEFDNITDGYVKTLKGSRKAAMVEFTHAYDPADAGQIAIMAAFEAEGDYAFELEFADKPTTGAAPKNSRRLWIGKVMKLSTGGENGNTVGKLTYGIAINSNVVRVAASAT